MKNGSLICNAKMVAFGALKMTANQRYDIHLGTEHEYDTSASTYSFRIKNVQETDAGTYQCRLSDSPPKKSLCRANGAIIVSIKVEIELHPKYCFFNSCLHRNM